MSLTAAQQDYLETIFRLEEKLPPGKIRITDIALELGTKLPTVTRTVKKLTVMGYIKHQSHGLVILTKEGRAVAAEIVHLHDDLIFFFKEVLGLTDEQAKLDSCQVEHGFSPIAAQRLHEFLEFYASMNEEYKKLCKRFIENASQKPNDFKKLSDHKVFGWRS